MPRSGPSSWGNYNTRKHSAIGVAPIESWRGKGWLPRLPDDLEALDTLLVMVVRPRVIRGDGIHFEGLRFLSSTLAAYVGASVIIRYDPRDIGEIRVFHRHAFLCRAVNAEHADRSVTLKDVQAARSAHRRKVRQEIKEKRGRVTDLLPSLPARSRLSIYAEDR